ncbi:MAG: cyclodeaminase/cyclohydrolase family protein [Treponema sp.]|jgi:formiminotetrahydrofolate cyclodeaminase|nr:cyclodeaminase/cyclohydrolase family protein [Treponema sp.]
MRLTNETLETFSRRLASADPAPGGGSSAAAEAALGIGLITMAAAVSAEKREYTHRKEELAGIIETAGRLRQRLLSLVDADAAAYAALMAARGIRNAEDRRRALEEAVQGAVLAPYHILSAALDGLRLAQDLAKDYYPPTASDVGLGAQSLLASARGAELTILINLPGLADSALKQRYRRDSQAMLGQAAALAGAVYAETRRKLLEKTGTDSP